MPSGSEVNSLLIKALRPFLDNDSEVGQASGGTIFVRFGGQVFEIIVDRKQQFDTAPEGEAARFMKTLPYPDMRSR